MNRQEIVVPNLALIGFMATGKSTIGRQCARALDFWFRDSDAFIERRAGKPVPELFRERGEVVFRLMETRAIRELSRQSNVVIATGGGVPLRGANVAYLRRTSVIILLQTTVDEILRRVGDGSSRPLLAQAEDPRARIETLLRERDPAYRAAAHTVVETTGLTRQESVERVLEAYASCAACFSHWSPPSRSRS